MKKKSLIKQWLHRWDQESPDFFKRLFRIARMIIAGATSILLPEFVIPSVKIPEWLTIAAGHVLVAGLVMMAVSKAATKSPQPEDNPDKSKQNEEN